MEATTNEPNEPKKKPRAKKAPRAPANDVVKAIEIAYEVPQPEASPELAKVAKALKGRRRPPPASDPAVARAQLRRVVAQYEDVTEEIKRTRQRTGDYHDRETGEVTNACSLSPEQIGVFNDIADAFEKAKGQVEREMARLLEAFPVYRIWLKNVAGVGTVTAAKLLADIDIRRCEKVSALHRVCGLAVRVDSEGKGKAQRAVAGQPLDFHGRLKVGLYQAWTSLVKSQKRDESPYYRRGVEYKHRLLTSPRFVEHPTKKDATGKPAATFDGRPGGRAIVNNMCWRPAMQLFLEHLYIVWRALEGLPVWPSYEAAKLGYAHGGKVCVNVPKVLTIDEALEAVGASAFGEKERASHCERMTMLLSGSSDADRADVDERRTDDRSEPTDPLAAKPACRRRASAAVGTEQASRLERMTQSRSETDASGVEVAQ